MGSLNESTVPTALVNMPPGSDYSVSAPLAANTMGANTNGGNSSGVSASAIFVTRMLSLACDSTPLVRMLTDPPSRVDSSGDPNEQAHPLVSALIFSENARSDKHSSEGPSAWLSGSNVRRQNRFIEELFEVAASVSKE